jgi:hypothetical protein
MHAGSAQRPAYDAAGGHDPDAFHRVPGAGDAPPPVVWPRPTGTTDLLPRPPYLRRPMLQGTASLISGNAIQGAALCASFGDFFCYIWSMFLYH